MGHLSTIVDGLFDIVYEYKESEYYSYVPGTHSDDEAGWEYYGEKFKQLYKSLNQCVGLTVSEYRGLYKIIEGLHTFARQFERADGLPRLFMQANYNLQFYQNVFLFEPEQRAELRRAGVGIPTDEEYIISDRYHAENDRKSEKLNLQYDTDDFFIQELAYALRVLIRDVFYNEEVR